MWMFATHDADGEAKLSAREERQLVARARKGCQKSLRRLIETHKERLSAFVWRVLRNHHDTEDVCQDAFLRAFASLDSFSTEYRFSTWLFTIAYRLSLNHIRRKQSLSGDLDFSIFADDQSDHSEDVVESEDARRLKALIWSAVDELSVPQRASILLFYREGMSCHDIAHVLEMPMATVKSHLHRARARLREVLEPYAGENWIGLRLISESA